MEDAKVQMTHPWWQPGVFASAPAIFLWVCARLPADMLGNVFHAGTAPSSLTHVGDTLFVIGWTASGVLLWHGRRRHAKPETIGEADATREPASSPEAAAAPAHGLTALRKTVAQRWERMRHPIPMH